MTLPPGRLRLATRQICTGSPTIRKTTGMVAVAALAASAPAVGLVSMSATWQRTRSAAIAGSRSYWPSAQRYSGPDILMLDIAGVVQALAECAERIRAAGGLACPCFWAYFGIDSAVGDDLGIAFCTGRKNQHSPMRRSVRWMPCARNC